MGHGQLQQLAGEIRDFLIDKVRASGGHLGPNLGVVELTIALHRVFDSPRDAIVFDVGHQSYVHKIVTGRRQGFDLLRQRGGVAGYPIGGFAEHLASLRLQPGYERMLDGGKEILLHTPVVGKSIYAALHAAKAGIKDALSPQMMFSDLGLKYLGPVDGHDLLALEKALQAAKAFGGPVIVHAVTEKG